MRIIMCTDVEGVAGVTSFDEQAAATGKYYEQARKLLTGEVNAAVEGMVREGVEEILVLDGHGAGGIVYEDLHPAARLAHGRPMAIKRFCDEWVPQYDAAIMVGQHAMAGAERGTLNHTQSHIHYEYYTLNGKRIGEIGQWGLCCGAYNVPLIFVSGDDCACREAEDLVRGIMTAAVKVGLSRTSAISCSIAESHRRIREGVIRAVQQQRSKPLPPLRMKGPYVLEKRFFHTGFVDGYAGDPRARIIDAVTVQLCSDNLLEIIYA